MKGRWWVKIWVNINESRKLLRENLLFMEHEIKEWTKCIIESESGFSTLLVYEYDKEEGREFKNYLI